MEDILFCFIETKDSPNSEPFKTFIRVNDCRLNKTQKLHFRGENIIRYDTINM